MNMTLLHVPLLFTLILTCRLQVHQVHFDGDLPASDSSSSLWWWPAGCMQVTERRFLTKVTTSQCHHTPREVSWWHTHACSEEQQSSPDRSHHLKTVITWQQSFPDRIHLLTTVITWQLSSPDRNHHLTAVITWQQSSPSCSHLLPLVIPLQQPSPTSNHLLPAIISCQKSCIHN